MKQVTGTAIIIDDLTDGEIKMIHKLSYHIAVFFRKKLLIEQSELATCCYGLEILTATLLGFGVIILAGFFWDSIFNVSKFFHNSISDIRVL